MIRKFSFLALTTLLAVDGDLETIFVVSFNRAEAREDLFVGESSFSHDFCSF